MTAREDVLDYGMTLPDVYIDAPFRDDNWVLLRCKKMAGHLRGHMSGMGTCV